MEGPNVERLRAFKRSAPRPTLDDLLYIISHAVPRTAVLQPSALDQKIEEHILNVYLWGSRVYGRSRPESDWDFTLVLDDEVKLLPHEYSPP